MPSLQGREVRWMRNRLVVPRALQRLDAAFALRCMQGFDECGAPANVSGHSCPLSMVYADRSVRQPRVRLLPSGLLAGGPLDRVLQKRLEGREIVRAGVVAERDPDDARLRVFHDE